MAADITGAVNVSAGQRIRELRRSRGMTQQELGDLLGVKNAAIHKYEKGLVVNLKRETVAKMAEIFGVTPAYIMGFSAETMSEKDVKPLGELRRQRIPLIGGAAAGEPIRAEEEAGVYVDVGERLRADCALTVRGRSMEPAYRDGDVIYIRSCPDVRDGAVAVVAVDDAVSLKHVYHDAHGVTLVSDNPAYAPMRFDPQNSDNIRIIGAVVGFTRLVGAGE